MEDGKMKSYNAAFDLGYIEPVQGGADVLFQKSVVEGEIPEDLEYGAVLKLMHKEKTLVVWRPGS